MKHDHQKYLLKILDSESFLHSPNIKNLLQYLVDCSAKGEPAKELQIASDVFKRDISGNDQDTSIVRVNVHNLRKKLNHYYLTEGKNDDIQFVIPKGRYEVEIIKKSTDATFSGPAYKMFSKPGALAVFFLTIFLSVLVSFFIFKSPTYSGNNKVAQTAIWKDFTQSNKKTMVVVGDYYFLREKDTIQDRNLIVRDFSINSYPDLTNFLSKHPDYVPKYSQAEFTYTGYSVPFVLKELVPVICANDFEICLMSQFKANYLQEYNIIFVGLYKTMGYLQTFFDYSGFKIEGSGNMARIEVKEGGDNKTYVQKGGTEGFHNDYGIVAKFRGINDNFIFIFTSLHDIGVIECMKQLTNLETLDRIQKDIGSKNNTDSPGFEILFQVIGLNRNDLNSKIIKINQMGPVFIFSDM